MERKLKKVSSFFPPLSLVLFFQLHASPFPFRLMGWSRCATHWSLPAIHAQFSQVKSARIWVCSLPAPSLRSFPMWASLALVAMVIQHDPTLANHPDLLDGSNHPGPCLAVNKTACFELTGYSRAKRASEFWQVSERRMSSLSSPAAPASMILSWSFSLWSQPARAALLTRLLVRGSLPLFETSIGSLVTPNSCSALFSLQSPVKEEVA